MTIHDYYGQKNGLLVLSMFLFYFCSRFIYNLIKSRKTWKYITLKPRSLKTSWTGLRIYPLMWITFVRRQKRKSSVNEWITRMSAYVLPSPHELYRLSGIPESWHTRKSSIKSTTKRRM